VFSSSGRWVKVVVTITILVKMLLDLLESLSYV
jgi:hypothetical protein